MFWRSFLEAIFGGHFSDQLESRHVGYQMNQRFKYSCQISKKDYTEVTASFGGHFGGHIGGHFRGQFEI